jgi:predicted neuraminidase
MKQTITLFCLLLCVLGYGSTSAAAQEKPFHRAELLFPVEHWHNHSSAIVELPNGDLFVCWFNGSGERQADDVKIEGARLRRNATKWSQRYTLADTPGYPDTNCTMFIDPQGRLWLIYPTILANEWHTALLKYKISSNYLAAGPPKWDSFDVLHVTPGPSFEPTVNEALSSFTQKLNMGSGEAKERLSSRIADIRQKASDKLYSRLGWMTRAHPFVLDQRRLIVPLYSDGFSFSLMAISDDWGKSWHTSTPLVGAGNIQPSIVRRKDGSLYTLMRDNGPAPKRLQASESRDRGETWTPVVDTDLPNPGSGAEIISLKNGHWVLISNDTERGRNSLLVSISDDEGRTWKWKRHLEKERDGEGAAEFHYPSIIQAKDGSLHASYSYFMDRRNARKDAQGRLIRKSIKHAHFNEAWVMAGDGVAN